MKLRDVLDGIEDAPDNATLYAEGGTAATAESAAAVVDEEVIPGPNGTELRYLLEVSLAREVIDVWSTWRGGKEPTSCDRWEAVLYYAANDAYLPV